MSELKSQADFVIAYCRRNGSITSKDAFTVGITRLSAVIYQIKKRGYIVTSKQEKCINSFGNSCTYSRYFIEEQ